MLFLVKSFLPFAKVFGNGVKSAICDDILEHRNLLCSSPSACLLRPCFLLASCVMIIMMLMMNRNAGDSLYERGQDRD